MHQNIPNAWFYDDGWLQAILSCALRRFDLFLVMTTCTVRWTNPRLGLFEHVSKYIYLFIIYYYFNC